MTSPLVIYVDVDDTLVRSIGTKRIPMPQTVGHVRQLCDEGAVLYCWSTGGAAYAEETAAELGIHECFSAFLPKPNVILDDQPVDAWRGTLHVHPLEGAALDASEYRRRLEA